MEKKKTILGMLESEISVITSSVSSHTIKEAWFDKTKAGREVTGWKKRFFVLNLESKVISYFSDEAKTDKKGAYMVV